MDINKIDYLIASGNFQEALSLLSIKVKECPNDWHTHYRLGLCYRGLSKYSDAIEHYQRSLLLNPEEYSTYLNLGIALQLKGDYAKALSTLKEGIKYKDDYILAYNSIGFIYKKMGELTKAQEWYNKGLKKLFGQIYRRLSQQNKIENLRTGYQEFQEGLWVEKAMDVFFYYAAKEGFVAVLFPTGESALEYYNSKEHGGMFYITKETPKGKARMILPNYFDTIFKILKSDTIYSVLLNNIGAVLIESQDYENAKKFLEESIRFIPDGVEYPPPFIGLDILWEKTKK